MRAVLRRLEDARELPLSGDVFARVPPDEESDPAREIQVLAHAHRIGNRNLWVWYREKGGDVELVAITDALVR